METKENAEERSQKNRNVIENTGSYRKNEAGILLKTKVNRAFFAENNERPSDVSAPPTPLPVRGEFSFLWYYLH